MTARQAATHHASPRRIRQAIHRETTPAVRPDRRVAIAARGEARRLRSEGRQVKKRGQPRQGRAGERHADTAGRRPRHAPARQPQGR